MVCIYTPEATEDCSTLHAFSSSEDGVYLHTRSDGRLFNLARLRAKTKVRRVLIRDMLLADDAARTTHSEEALQRHINCFAHACGEFGLTISTHTSGALHQEQRQTDRHINEGTLHSHSSKHETQNKAYKTADALAMEYRMLSCGLLWSTVCCCCDDCWISGCCLIDYLWVTVCRLVDYLGLLYAAVCITLG